MVSMEYRLALAHRLEPVENSARALKKSLRFEIPLKEVEMKSRRLAVCFALLSLAVPASAQRANKVSATQELPAANEREPLKAHVPTDFWDGDDPNLSNLVTHPFANHGYIQRQTGPIHDRLNELDELTSQNSRMITNADTQAQHGLQMASEKASLADQHASDAMNRAQLAKSAAMDASMRVAAAEGVVGNLDQYNGREQTEIRFRPGQTVLSRNSKNALDTMAGPLESQKGYLIEIHGIAPGRGRAANANAKKMSDSVVRYLVSTHKIPMYRISVLNMVSGRMSRSRHARGRVEISVLQKGTVATARR